MAERGPADPADEPRREPPGGHAAERRREFLRARFPTEDDTPEMSGIDGPEDLEDPSDSEENGNESPRTDADEAPQPDDSSPTDGQHHRNG